MVDRIFREGERLSGTGYDAESATLASFRVNDYGSFDFAHSVRVLVKRRRLRKEQKCVCGMKEADRM